MNSNVTSLFYSAVDPVTPSQPPSPTASDLPDIFTLYPKENCKHRGAIFAIGGSARLWHKHEKTNWTSSENPLNVSIIYGSPNKWQTPLIHRIRNLQKHLSSKLVGRNRNKPTVTERYHYIPVLNGEVKNQEVCDMRTRPDTRQSSRGQFGRSSNA